jgi:hypothetical protein
MFSAQRARRVWSTRSSCLAVICSTARACLGGLLTGSAARFATPPSRARRWPCRHRKAPAPVCRTWCSQILLPCSWASPGAERWCRRWRQCTFAAGCSSAWPGAQWQYRQCNRCRDCNVAPALALPRSRRPCRAVLRTETRSTQCNRRPAVPAAVERRRACMHFTTAGEPRWSRLGGPGSRRPCRAVLRTETRSTQCNRRPAVPAAVERRRACMHFTTAGAPRWSRRAWWITVALSACGRAHRAVPPRPRPYPPCNRGHPEGRCCRGHLAAPTLPITSAGCTKLLFILHWSITTDICQERGEYDLSQKLLLKIYRRMRISV